MVRLVDAISKITVNGKMVKEIPENQYAITRIVKSTTQEEPLQLKNQLNLDLYVSPNKNVESAHELIGALRGRLDECGEWAPWSKIARMKQHK